MFNFVAFFPIFFHGMFDRNLEKSYVRKNPEVYKATQQKEQIAPRNLCRWILIAVIHVVFIYQLQFSVLSKNGTSAGSGLMRNRSNIGDGEVGDLESMGTIMFSSLVLLVTYTLLFESRSILNGIWPTAFLYCCKKDVKSKDGGFWSRIPWTWYGILIGMIWFYFLLFLFLYAQLGIWAGPSIGTMYLYTGVTNHILGTSSLNYVVMLFIPIGGMAIDVAGKAFSNMYYPSQNQIHIELQSKSKA